MSDTDVPARIADARAVVFEDGRLIDPADLDDALRERGVTITEGEDGTPAYEDVPETLSLSACHLAVDLRKDPATFLE